MKHKLLITGLATATLLSTAALTQLSPSVYADGGATATVNADDAKKAFLAEFDKASSDTANKFKEQIEKETDAENKKALEAALAKFKEDSSNAKKEFEEGFANGLSVADAEKALDDYNKVGGSNTPVAPLTYTGNTLPEDLKAKIDAAEKAEANRPESEKLQDLADDLAGKIDKNKKSAEELNRLAAKKAAELEEEKKKTPKNQAEIDRLKAEIEELQSKAEARAAEVNNLIEDYNDVLPDLEEANRSEASEAALDKLEEELTNLENDVFKLE